MKKSGFTLVELITVVALIAIMVIVATSRMSNSSSYTTESNIRNIVYLLKVAQKTAIAQRRNVYVIQSGTDVSLCYISGTSCAVGSQVMQNGSVMNILLTNGVTVPNGIFFLPSGLSNASYSFTVASKTVKVDQITGYVYDV